MPAYSPELYQIKPKITPVLPPLERKMYRCMAFIIQRGGFNRRFVRFHNKKFPINNNGVTRAEALAEGISGAHRGFILILNGFKEGEYSKGYTVTKKGMKGLRRVLQLRFKKAPIPQVTKLPELSLHERIHFENLKKIHLSNEFYNSQSIRDPIYAEQFYRSYRHSRGGTGSFSTDKNGRIYYPLTNMAKGLRKLISLDQDGGEPLVEVDIKCSNPQMMLKAGLVHPDEALEWAVLINKDRFYQKFCGGNSFRASSKRYVNSVFNGSRGKTRSKLLKFFPKSGTNMSKETGNILMHTESRIMNSVLEELYDEEIVALRLHDAFLCRPADALYISSKLERLGVATNLKRPKPVELIRPY